MPDTIAIILLVVVLVITLVLAIYAGRLFRLLQQQKTQQQAQDDKRISYLNESILLISKAMREEQCEYSEGALRIWVLLENLQQQTAEQRMAAYPGIYQMYLTVKDMPTHSARKNQDKKLTRQQDKIRLQAEQDLKTQIQADISRLIAEFKDR
ncbi:DUF2489 domain-containing protein [Chromatiaceae bacterium AAb-1]|nr:DUF2489 domain-containing protein [Chromatiaceae bacterium AAb-1]